MKKLTILAVLLTVISAACFAEEGKIGETTKFKVVAKSDVKYDLYYVSENAGDVRVTIYDNRGRIISSRKVKDARKFKRTYDFSQLEPGKLKIVVRNKYCIDDSYIFSVASMLPHKNIEGLIRAYSLISSHDAKYLVLAGMKLKSFDTIKRTIKSVGLDETRVKLLGYVPDEDIPALYSSAELFVFPSFFEGFGLPPLESLTFGCPVVASSAGSIPEVLGDAALFVDPFNFEDIAENIEKLLKDKEHQKRLIQKGYERISFFSWKKTAEKVLNTYENIID